MCRDDYTSMRFIRLDLGNLCVKPRQISDMLHATSLWRPVLYTALFVVIRHSGSDFGGLFGLDVAPECAAEDCYVFVEIVAVAEEEAEAAAVALFCGVFEVSHLVDSMPKSCLVGFVVAEDVEYAAAAVLVEQVSQECEKAIVTD